MSHRSKWSCCESSWANARPSARASTLGQKPGTELASSASKAWRYRSITDCTDAVLAAATGVPAGALGAGALADDEPVTHAVVGDTLTGGPAGMAVGVAAGGKD